MIPALDFYNSQIQELGSSLKKLRKIFPWLYLFRLISFISFITFLVLFFQFEFSLYFLSFSLISLALFFFSVKLDLKFVYKEKFLSNQLRINEDELKFLDHQFRDQETGSEYIPLNPHLSIDFDLFGEGSLFQYLNRSSTKMGKKRLAEELCYSQFDKEFLIKRQKAVEELSGKMEFIQEFRTLGMFISEKGEESENLQSWINQTLEKRNILRILSIVIPVINTVWIVLIIAGIFTIVSYLLPFLLSSYILLLHSKKINEAHSKLGNSAKIFEMCAALIKLIEKEDLDSGYLVEIKNNFFLHNTKASDSLTSLFKLLNKFDLRLNMLVSFVLNALVLFDIQILLLLEKWKSANKKAVALWFDSLSTLDALISLATFAYNNADSVTWPSISEEGFAIKARDLAHPLIHSSVRISNDIHLQGNPSILIITGANMAGKSTFLRTISINLILAMNGAPVCARNFHFTPCEIMSSIKIQDSLANHESYFYAELLRLKDIIRHIETNPKTLVILDEILRGTNSKDKHQGSLGLLERLINMNAAVVIATHDLGIAELEHKYPEFVTNNCFEVELKDDQLIFDYKLKKGVSQKLNASFLMKKMEIIN